MCRLTVHTHPSCKNVPCEEVTHACSAWSGRLNSSNHGGHSTYHTKSRYPFEGFPLCHGWQGLRSRYPGYSARQQPWEHRRIRENMAGEQAHILALAPASPAPPAAAPAPVPAVRGPATRSLIHLIMLSVSVSATPAVSRTCGGWGCAGIVVPASLAVGTRRWRDLSRRRSQVLPCSPPPLFRVVEPPGVLPPHLVVPAGDNVGRLVCAAGRRHKRLAGLGRGAPARESTHVSNPSPEPAPLLLSS